MQRIVRQGPIPPSEAERYNKIRERIAAELPEILARRDAGIKTVLVTVEGGVISNMIIPDGVEVVVHDYDVDGSETNLYEDVDGGQYTEAVWCSK